MSVMRSMVWGELTTSERQQLVRRGLDDIFDETLRASISELIEDVRVRGDDAVCEALARHDGVTVRPDELRLDPDEIVAARVDAAVDEAIDDAIDHVRRFNERQLQQLAAWEFESEPGLVVGEKLTPISSVGVFVPSGKASYPSVAYQLAVPAIVAGVPEIVLVVPPMPGGGGAVDPAVLVVCAKLGITDVFRVNGPAGIAALGFGTEHIPAVRKVVGPGSPPVTLAQVEMQRHGLATVMLLGPTESLVIADATADPRRLAADLLIEAEHGTDSSVLLVTLDAALAADVDGDLARRLAELPPQRAEAATAALGVNGGCVVVSSLAEAIEVANAYAPEHLQLAIRADDVERAVDGVRHAGEILVGQDTPFSAANFVIGCPASLPTSGFARVSSGVTAATFLKRTAIARADARAIARMAPSVIALADHEGFPAHAQAVRERTR
ncbi:MAG: histidinol dehydrogenase [Acidimicrobiia bacterium]|nr:histidinol dehydrogenase [Acidimicrobiia bacterium]MBA3802746.1 histidinol dehydrogenase [Acidimicrobiia bacterium]